jgi:hypothetical protein
MYIELVGVYSGCLMQKLGLNALIKIVSTFRSESSMFDDIFSHFNPYLEHQSVEDTLGLDNLPDDNDWVQNIQPQEYGELESFSSFGDSVSWFGAESAWNPSEFDGLGNPIQDAQFWQQQNGANSCAVVAQMSVYESITGVDLSEAEVCKMAEENGWYDPETGTQSNAVGKILNALGVPTDQRYDANLEDIANALEQGDKVIVGLDANEIWTPLRDPATNAPIEQPNAGHAVWVTGVDQQADGSVKIILNDSGTPDGQMKVVDAEDFLNAWTDYGNQLVVAHAPQKQVIV